MALKRYSTNEGFDAADLLRYATDHREAAVLLFRTGFAFHDSAGYLAHLAVELLLKALVLDAVGSFPNEHRLAALVGELRKSQLSFVLSLDGSDALDLLDDLRELRYPHPTSPVPVGHRHRDALLLLWRVISPQVPADLQSRYAMQDANKKGGRILMVRTSRDAQ